MSDTCTENLFRNLKGPCTPGLKCACSISTLALYNAGGTQLLILPIISHSWTSNFSKNKDLHIGKSLLKHGDIKLERGRVRLY